MLIGKKSSKSSNFSDVRSKVGSDAVSAFCMGRKVVSLLSITKCDLAFAGRSFDAGWLCDLVLAFFSAD